jgi:hypothetical protein
MKHFPSPTEAMRLAMQSSMMLAEANMVIAMRMMGMGGMWRVSPGENDRMVQEKTDAAVASGAAMTRAMLAGHSPAKIALAAMKPVRAKTRANATRLAKQGLGKPTK